ncbi:hypothetical protein AGMMS49574_10260 [Bacteroidia bacterium]|nr:hypothetical protein AGMMS49574_10260 [Bacteroidia bacterium]
MEEKIPKNIDEYIDGFPPMIQEIMTILRETIHEAAPEAREKISWGMPTFSQKKLLVQFGGFKNHLGFFPGPEAIEAFKDELTEYKTSKGTIQFPYKKPIPLELVKKIVGWKKGLTIAYVLMMGMTACSGNRNANLQVSYENAPKEYVENRMLPIEGAYNARDLGGYPAAEGKHVKWSKVIRTGDLNKLTDTDLQYLTQIPIITDIDFRDTVEVNATPDRVPATVVNQCYLPVRPGSIKDYMKLTPEVASHVLVDINEKLVTDFQSEYKEFFQILMNENNTPLLFHCSAGKDRTGYGAALFLASLGVDREIIIEDYMLSKKYVEKKYSAIVKAESVLEPIMTVKREYIEAAFDQIDKSYGGLGNYLTNYLGVDTLKMRKIYTE